VSDRIATAPERSEGADDGTPAGAGVSYWQLVKRQFGKNRLAVGALWMIWLLFVVAAAAPLLSNRKPLVFVRGGRISFPAFDDILMPERVIDILFNAVLVLAAVVPVLWLLMGLVGRLLRRAPWPGRVVRRWIVAGLVVGTLGCLSVGYRHRRLDHTPYADLVGEPNITAIRPPVFHHPYANDLEEELKPPSRRHWLGTDETGRDVLSRIIHGTRISLSVGFVAVGIALVIGVTVGALAGFFRGWVDIVIMRFIEVMMCFPTFFLIITIIAFLPRSIFTIMMVIGVTGWMGAARIVRGEFLRLRSREFVIGAEALGVRGWRIIFRHMLPNAMAPVLVSATFRVAGAILTEAALSFLGFGVAVPTASWGEILREAQRNVTSAWWLVIFPGVMVFLTVTAYNLVGEGVRDALDPRLKV